MSSVDLAASKKQNKTQNLDLSHRAAGRTPGMGWDNDMQEINIA